MKVEITKAQLNAISDVIDSVEGMIGCYDYEFNTEMSKGVKMFDRFLSKNNLPPRKLWGHTVSKKS